MIRITRPLALVLALTLSPLSSTLALAQTGDGPPRAVVSIEAARRTALARVAGTVRHEELEHEGGRWIYSFEIDTPAPGIEEVNIDATSGAIVSVEHEEE